MPIVRAIRKSMTIVPIGAPQGQMVPAPRDPDGAREGLALVILDQSCLLPVVRSARAFPGDADLISDVLIGYGIPADWSAPLAGLAGAQPRADAREILRGEVADCFERHGLLVPRVWMPQAKHETANHLVAVLNEHRCPETLIATSQRRRSRRRLRDLVEVASRYSSARVVTFS